MKNTIARFVLCLAVVGGAILAPVRAAAVVRETPLIDAVKKGDSATVRALLASRVDVNQPLVDGTTAMHWAVQRGDLDVVNRLIGAGADVRATNRYGINPLWIASTNGHAAITERLLKAGVDANAARLNTGETPMMIAARSGHADVVRLLLGHGANVHAKESVREQTALMWAAAEKHPDVVKALLEAGADIKAQSITKLTPIMFAIRAGDIDSTRLLLDAGADVNGRAADGTSLLVLALLNVRYRVASFLLERGADASTNDPHGRPLHVMTMMRRAENRGLSQIVPRLVPETEMDSLEFAAHLLKRGADINFRDPEGMRLFRTGYNGSGAHMAIAVPGFSLVGATAFLLAAANCDVPLMKFLAEHGADPRLPTTQKVTPLMAAAGIGFRTGERPGTDDEALAAVKLAFELGNDPAAAIDTGEGSAPARPGPGGYGMGPRLDGQTALHGAVVREAPAIAAWLIDHGTPIDHKARDGRTALDLTEIQSLGTTFEAQQRVAKVIRDKMIERGMPVSK